MDSRPDFLDRIDTTERCASGSRDDSEAVRAWRTISGISIATLTLLYTVLAAGLGASFIVVSDP